MKVSTAILLPPLSDLVAAQPVGTAVACPHPDRVNHGPGGRVLLARSATVDRLIDGIKPFNPTVIQTNLTKDREGELVAALQG
jgi:hypothetical protein